MDIIRYKEIDNIKGLNYSEMYNKVFLKDCGNKKLDEINFLFGWNSIIHLTVKDNKFCINQVLKKKGKDWLAIENVGSETCTQVFTRGVNSCTFVYLTNGFDYWLFHLDCDVLNTFEDILTDIGQPVLNLKAPSYKCVISHINTDAENAFCNRLSLMPWISDIYEFDRGRMPEKDEKGIMHLYEFYSHIEIGVYFNDGNPILYGDLISQFSQRQEFLDYNKEVVIPYSLNTKRKKVKTPSYSSSSSSSSPSSSSATPSSATPKSD